MTKTTTGIDWEHLDYCDSEKVVQAVQCSRWAGIRMAIRLGHSDTEIFRKSAQQIGEFIADAYRRSYPMNDRWWNDSVGWDSRSSDGKE